MGIRKNHSSSVTGALYVSGHGARSMIARNHSEMMCQLVNLVLIEMGDRLDIHSAISILDE